MKHGRSILRLLLPTEYHTQCKDTSLFRMQRNNHGEHFYDRVTASGSDRILSLVVFALHVGWSGSLFEAVELIVGLANLKSSGYELSGIRRETSSCDNAPQVLDNEKINSKHHVGIECSSQSIIPLVAWNTWHSVGVNSLSFQYTSDHPQRRHTNPMR